MNKETQKCPECGTITCKHEENEWWCDPCFKYFEIDKNGYDPSERKELTIIKAIKEYKNGVNAQKVAKKYKVNESTMLGWLKKTNTPRRTPRKYNWDEIIRAVK